MDRFSRMWKNTNTEPDVMTSSMTSRKRERARPSPVDEIRDDQADNPYTEIQLLNHHTDIIRHLVKVGNNCCLTAADDGLAVVWDVDMGRRLLVLSGHRGPITCVLLLPKNKEMHSVENENFRPSLDDSILWTAASDRQIIIWNTNTGECCRSLTEHQCFVKCLVSMRQGVLVVSGGSEKICVWSRAGDLLSTFILDTNDGSVNFMVAIMNDRIVVALEKQLVVYQLIDEEIDGQKIPKFIPRTTLLPHREAIKSLVNVSASTFASGSLDGTLVLWGSHSLSRCRSFNSKPDYQDRQKSFPYSVQFVFSVEEHYIFAAIGSGFFVYDLSGQILAEKTSAHYSKIIHMAFVYNGQFLATCSEDGKIRLWGASRCPKPSEKKLSIVEQFLGVRREDFSTLRGDNPPVEPLLMGECVGHSGTVLNLLDFGPEGFVSCGVDNLVILWRDGVVQGVKRTEIAHDMMVGATASI